jgi:hypothetical protein
MRDTPHSPATDAVPGAEVTPIDPGRRTLFPVPGTVVVPTFEDARRRPAYGEVLVEWPAHGRSGQTRQWAAWRHGEHGVTSEGVEQSGERDADYPVTIGTTVYLHTTVRAASLGAAQAAVLTGSALPRGPVVVTPADGRRVGTEVTLANKDWALVDTEDGHEDLPEPVDHHATAVR